MQKFPTIQSGRGSKGETTGAAHSTNLAPASSATAWRKAAKAATERLFRLLPPLDVADQRAFMAGAIALFEQYPPEVQILAAHRIPHQSDRPTLRLMREVLEDVYAPLRRREEREQVARERARSLPPLRHRRTPEEQARVDWHVARVRRELGI